MKHCNGCSHPTICNTMGCAAEEARANKAKAAEPSCPEIKAQRDELLAALNRMIQAGKRVGWHIHPKWKALIDQSEAAIAKVKGKEGGAA